MMGEDDADDLSEGSLTVNPCGRECQLLRQVQSSILFLRVFSVLYYYWLPDTEVRK